MARKSVKEILEAARQGGPVSSGGPRTPADTAPETPSDALSPAQAAPLKATMAAAPAPTGRPLSLKEKLAAARAGAVPGATVPSAATPPDVEEPVAASTVPQVAADVPTPASLGRPLTLQEKMAAARAKGGPASAGSPPTRPGVAPPTKAPAAKSAPKRELPPLDEIKDPKDLAEAMRQAAAKKEVAAAAAAKLNEPAAKTARPKETRPSSVLPRPSKNTAASVEATPGTSVRRRRFLLFTGLSVVWVAWGSFVAGLAAFTAMLGRFMFPNVLAEPPSTVKVGVTSNYDPESVNERFKAEWGFWIVRSTRYDGQDVIYALKSVCTHLGCPPNWLEGEQKFKCPCHGSGFYISGVNFEGPAPRPLERFKVALADDGQIVVDKSQIFQQERDQWTDPDSFILA